MERGPVTRDRVASQGTFSILMHSNQCPDGARRLRKRVKPLTEQVMVITGASIGNGSATAREAVHRLRAGCDRGGPAADFHGQSEGKDVR